MGLGMGVSPESEKFTPFIAGMVLKLRQKGAWGECVRNKYGDG